MLFRRRFTQCAMTIPFILLSLSLFFFIPLEGVNLTFEGDDKPVTASAYYVTRINQLARDIITVARCFLRVLHYIVNFEIIALNK